jgi:MFS family permease
LAHHPSLNDTQQSAEQRAGARAWYAVGLLLCLYILSFFGRQIISLLVEPLEKDLGLTEVQIGLLIGFSFTLVYAIGGIAFGWFVDTFPRKLIIFVGTIVWALSCIGCGLTTSFGWLFVARMGVGIGEATLMPAAYALLSDTFPRRRLATALGIFSFGATFGIAISLGLGGYLLALFARSRGIETPLGHLDPWQAAFVISGCPPLVFGLLALTLPEPTRQKRAFGHQPAATSLLAVLRRRRGIMAAQFAGFSMNALMGYTLMAWAPAFMGRSYGWKLGQIGPALALALGLGGAIATLGSGYLADRMWARGIQGSHYMVAASALAVSSPFGVVAFLSPSPWIFLGGIFVVYFAAAVGLNMGATSLQLLTPPAVRGRLSGLYLFCTNMFGAGLGPLIVAMLTQHLFHDRAKVGIAMAIVTPTAALTGAIILGLAWRRYATLINTAEDSIDEVASVDVAAPGVAVLGTKS